MSKYSIRIAPALLLLVALLTTSCDAHSYMVSPAADYLEKDNGQCRLGGPDKKHPDGCLGPCIDKRSWRYNKKAPVTEWARGETRTASWHLNTHNHGFVRLALVPVKDRMNLAAHNRGEFHVSCFDSNSKKCAEGEFCGTGTKKGTTDFTVPAVPDGDYILGWAWYGSYGTTGVGATMRKYLYGDYWSCSNIRIRGGVPVSKKRPFKFVPGTGAKTCKSMTNKLGVCKIEPCPNAYGKREPQELCAGGMELKNGECVLSKHFSLPTTVKVATSPTPAPKQMGKILGNSISYVVPWVMYGVVGLIAISIVVIMIASSVFESRENVDDSQFMWNSV